MGWKRAVRWQGGPGAGNADDHGLSGGPDDIARSVVTSAADAILAIGLDHRVEIWNPAAERMFGWTAVDVVGREAPFVPEELRAEHNAVLERVASGGEVSFATRRA